MALHRSLVATAIGLGKDGDRYRRHMGALVESIDDLLDHVLGPVLRPPRHPITLARFGLPAVLPATLLASTYREPRTRALLAGIAAHSVTALNRPLTSAIALLLGAAGHAFGWPIARGGSAAIAGALAQYFESLGGRVVTGQVVESLDDLPPADS